MCFNCVFLFQVGREMIMLLSPWRLDVARLLAVRDAFFCALVDADIVFRVSLAAMFAVGNEHWPRTCNLRLARNA